MGAILFIAIFLPVFVGFAIYAARRQRAAQARRIAEYRRSPDSKLLKL